MVSYPIDESSNDLTGLFYTNYSLVNNTSVLALGITAYYMASVIVFWVTPLLYRERAGKEQSILQLVKILTLVIASNQAFSRSQIVSYYFLGGDSSPYVYAAGLSWITLVCGALICMWIADRYFSCNQVL